ncbi:hypothetical protein CK203_050487 [Vitis vinifera]|uniref:CCHC-type domain-containing protein n=1 Tax=Vitis vinifera TaxID=29760 RepID=A0A438H1X7_VITVI|nr:hypothetical protein CK203_050487 [Vitis vinifera]
MRNKGKENIREYIMEMSNLVTRFKALKLKLSEDILVHLVLISLPTQFSPFKISYNTQKEKWTLNELIAQCVQEEERMKQEKLESAHLASTSQGFGTSKKRNRDNKGKQTTISGTSKQKVQKKQDKKITCFFCKKVGHIKKTCTKYAAGMKSKYTMSRTPSQNGVAEKRNRTLKDMIKKIVDTPEIPPTQVMEPVQVHEDVTQQPPEPQVQVPLRRSTKERRSTISYDYVVYLQEHEFDMVLEDDPISVSQVKQSSDSEKWIEAMKDEMKSMNDNGVWDLVELKV